MNAKPQPPANDGAQSRIRARTAEPEQALASAAAERRRLYDVLETLPVYVILLAKDYRVPFANKFFRERFGESHGWRCFEYLFHRAEPCEHCETYTVLKTGAPHRWAWTGPDGRAYDIYDYPFNDADGTPMILEMGIDITEVKKAQAALAELNATLEQRVARRTAELEAAAERLRIVADFTYDWEYWRDQDGRFGYIAPSCERITGHASNDFMRDPDLYLRLVHPDDRERIARHMREDLLHGARCELEFRIVRRDGQERWIGHVCQPVTGPDGRPMGRRASNRDITESKKAEEALRASEAHARWLARFPEENPSPVVRVSADGIVLYRNPAAAESTGWRCAVGEPLRNKHVQALVDKVLREGRTIERDLHLGGTHYAVAAVAVATEGYVNVYGRDVTERVQAEESLRTSEARYRTLYESMTDGLANHAVVYEDGKAVDYVVTGINPAFVRITGISPEKAVGRRASELYGTGVPPYLDVYARVAAGGEPERFETYFAPMDKYLEILVFSSGKGEFVTVFVDVTERRRAQEALMDAATHKQAAQHARSLIEVSPDPLVTISAGGQITDVNEATIKATGVTREDLIGTDFCDYFTEPEMAKQGYQQAFARGLVTDYPLTIRHRDGSLMDVLYNASVYRDAHGTVLGVFAAARNITARKQASLYARSLIEASPDPLVTISADGKITDVNEATIKATGVTREDLVGTDFCGYFTEPEKAKRGYQQVFAQGYVTDYPLTIRHRDGRLMDVLYNASLYRDTHGEVQGVFAAARDVTVQKRAEAELKRHKDRLEILVKERTAEMERSNKDLARSNENLEQFAYVASHDLQEPLRIMASYSQLLEKRYRGRLDQDADDFIGFIVEAAGRMQKLISDLLAYSRAGRTGELEDVDCNEVVRRVVRGLKAAIESAGASVTFDTLPVVRAHEAGMTQVFQNLIGNALKFRRDGVKSEVHIGASWAPAVAPAAPQGGANGRRDSGALTAGGRWNFWVRDNGIGIEPRHVERIFVIFQRLHDHGKYSGTGIGLSICKKIVADLGGRIWVESEPGKGSTFRFTVPDRI